MSDDIIEQLKRQISNIEASRIPNSNVSAQNNAIKLASNANPITIRATVLDSDKLSLNNKIVSWNTNVDGIVHIEPSADTLSCKITPISGITGSVGITATTIPTSGIPVRQNIIISIFDPQPVSITLTVDSNG
jgi:hypothetical protein